jgi:hypothetical protein
VFLRATMTPVTLSIYAAGQLGDAIHDLPHTTPQMLWSRFLSWTRP